MVLSNTEVDTLKKLLVKWRDSLDPNTFNQQERARRADLISAIQFVLNDLDTGGESIQSENSTIYSRERNTMMNSTSQGELDEDFCRMIGRQLIAIDSRLGTLSQQISQIQKQNVRGEARDYPSVEVHTVSSQPIKKEVIDFDSSTEGSDVKQKDLLASIFKEFGSKNNEKEFQPTDETKTDVVVDGETPVDISNLCEAYNHTLNYRPKDMLKLTLNEMDAKKRLNLKVPYTSLEESQKVFLIESVGEAQFWAIEASFSNYMVMPPRKMCMVHDNIQKAGYEEFFEIHQAGTSSRRPGAFIMIKPAIFQEIEPNHYMIMQRGILRLKD